MTLVDTSSWIEALRKNGDKAVTEKVKKLILDGKAVVCPLVMLELWNGARGRAEKKNLGLLSKTLPSAEIDGKVWDGAYELARRCREKGKTVPATDILIAACAGRHGLDLEHSDGHFDTLMRIAND